MDWGSSIGCLVCLFLPSSSFVFLAFYTGGLQMIMPMMLYHYFDSKIGPFRNLSDLTDEEADRVILQFRQQKRVSKETLYLTQ